MLYLSLAAVPADRAFIISVQIQVVTDRDLEALDRILDTFLVVGGLVWRNWGRIPITPIR